MRDLSSDGVSMAVWTVEGLGTTPISGAGVGAGGALRDARDGGPTTLQMARVFASSFSGPLQI